MGVFDIKYSDQTISGRGTGALMDADAAAAPYRALQGAGGAVFDVGAKIRQVEDDAEYSKLKRQTEERWNAAYESMQNIQDAGQRQQFWAKAQQDIESLQGSNNRVQTKLTEWRNNAMPQYQVWFNGLDRKMRINSAKAEFEITGQKLLEQGRVDEYKTLMTKMLDDGLILPIEHDEFTKNAQTNSTFAQARLLMDTNPERAIQYLDSMTGLDTKQLDAKEALKSTARSIIRQTGTASENKLHETVADYQKAIVNGDVDIKAMVQKIHATPGMTPEHNAKAVDDVTLFFRNWGNTLANKSVSGTDAIRSMEKAVDDLTEGRIDRQRYWDIFAENKEALSESHVSKYIQEAEPSWNKFIQNISRIADDNAKASIVTTSDAAWELMQIKHATGKMNTDIFNAEALKRSAETQIYTDYQNAVLELKRKDLTEQEFRSQLKILHSMYAVKEWGTEYDRNKDLKERFRNTEKQINGDFDTQFGQGTWDKLNAAEKAAVIERISQGQTMEQIVRDINAGLL